MKRKRKQIKKIVKKPVKKRVNKPVKKKRIKIRYGRLFLAIIILGLLIYLFKQFVNFPIKNIFISNNTILTDQEIIDIAGISNYPSIIGTTNNSIRRRLEKNIYIKKATVTKKKLKEIYIKVDENYPLFYDSSINKTILLDKSKVDIDSNAPILVNYVPDTIYKDFLDKMSKINRDILNRISEIKYDPNSVDEERFIFTMNDGNYVYLTLIHFEKINNYVEILKNFESQKGILYLDSGEYFQVYE